MLFFCYSFFHEIFTISMLYMIAPSYNITMTAEQINGDQGTLSHQTSTVQFIIHTTNN